MLTLVEAGALLGVAGWWTTQAAEGGITAGEGGITAAEVFLIVFAAGVALVLAAAARALARGRRGARGPILTWQVLQAITATTVLGVPQARLWAVVAIAWAAALFALLIISAGPAGSPAPPERD